MSVFSMKKGPTQNRRGRGEKNSHELNRDGNKEYIPKDDPEKHLHKLIQTQDGVKRATTIEKS